MRNAYNQDTLLKRLSGSPIKKTNSEKKLELMLEESEPFENKDLVLIDSSILQLGTFLRHTDFNKFEDYSTKGLMHINEKINTYEEIFSEEKTKITQKVYFELENLLDLISFRLNNGTLPPEKRVDRNWFRHRINSVEKAKTNKIIYGEIKEKIYNITKQAESKLIIPTEQDKLLFEIVNTISSVRKLKESKTFRTKKEHDYNSTTDEWLVTQAFNRTLFNQQSTTILSNDKDMARLLIDTSRYLKSTFLKKETEYCFNILNEKPVILANPNLEIYSSEINPNLFYSLGYKQGNKQQWKQIFQKIKPAQDKFLELMKQQEKNFYK